MVMMYSMSPSIYAYMAVMSTARGVLFFKYFIPAVVYPPLELMICAVSLNPLCTKICPGVDRFLGVLPFHWQFICFALLKSCVVS